MVTSTTMEDSSTRTTDMEEGVKEDKKPDIIEFYKKLACRSPLDGGLETEGKNTEEIDYWATVDTFLSSVQPVRSEPIDVGDEAILRRFRSTANYIKRYKQEVMNDTKSDDDDDDGDGEEEETLREITGGKSGIPVPTVSAEAERLLRGARTLHQQTAELRSFLKDLLPEKEPGERVDPPSCPELEDTSVRKMLSPSRKIAQAKEELEMKEEYPAAEPPDHIQKSLDKCILVLTGFDA